MGLRPKFEVIVLGGTNAGKSTFLNHLIGTNPRLLNTSELRETNMLWEVKFKKDMVRNRISEYTKSGERVDYEVDDLEELQRIIARYRPAAGEETKEEVRKVVICLNQRNNPISPQAKYKFKLIDVPGLNDATECYTVRDYV